MFGASGEYTGRARQFPHGEADQRCEDGRKRDVGARQAGAWSEAGQESSWQVEPDSVRCRTILLAAGAHESSPGWSGRSSPRTDPAVSGVRPSQSRRSAKASLEFSAALFRQRDSLFATKPSSLPVSRFKKVTAGEPADGAARRNNRSRSIMKVLDSGYCSPGCLDVPYPIRAPCRESDGTSGVMKFHFIS